MVKSMHHCCLDWAYHIQPKTKKENHLKVKSMHHCCLDWANHIQPENEEGHLCTPAQGACTCTIVALVGKRTIALIEQAFRLMPVALCRPSSRVIRRTTMRASGDGRQAPCQGKTGHP